MTARNAPLGYDMGRTNESLILYKLSQKAFVGNHFFALSVAQKRVSRAAYRRTFARLPKTLLKFILCYNSKR